MVLEKTKPEKKATTAKKTNAQKAAYDKEQYLFWYQLMLRIRRFEERCLMAYSQQKIRGFLHVYIGQESIAAGMESALKPGDAIVTAYRQHGTAIGRGVSTKAAMAELYGCLGSDDLSRCRLRTADAQVEPSDAAIDGRAEYLVDHDGALLIGEVDRKQRAVRQDRSRKPGGIAKRDKTEFFATGRLKAAMGVRGHKRCLADSWVG